MLDYASDLCTCALFFSQDAVASYDTHVRGAHGSGMVSNAFVRSYFQDYDEKQDVIGEWQEDENGNSFMLLHLNQISVQRLGGKKGKKGSKLRAHAEDEEEEQVETGAAPEPASKKQEKKKAVRVPAAVDALEATQKTVNLLATMVQTLITKTEEQSYLLTEQGKTIKLTADGLFELKTKSDEQDKTIKMLLNKTTVSTPTKSPSSSADEVTPTQFDKLHNGEFRKFMVEQGHENLVLTKSAFDKGKTDFIALFTEDTSTEDGAIRISVPLNTSGVDLGFGTRLQGGGGADGGGGGDGGDEPLPRPAA